MNEVTRILQAVEAGDAQAAARLMPLVYDDLRRVAARQLADEKAGQTLQPTALVHEAYLRLVDVDQAQRWNSRGHFFSACAEAMRRILIDRARAKAAGKRGGGRARVDLDDAAAIAQTPPDDLLAFDDALGLLAANDPTAAALVKLMFYGGRPVEEAG
ncbi:MAG: ECF-type sigma factor, partial [Gemmataceae bacterium]